MPAIILFTISVCLLVAAAIFYRQKKLTVAGWRKTIAEYQMTRRAQNDTEEDRASFSYTGADGSPHWFGAEAFGRITLRLGDQVEILHSEDYGRACICTPRFMYREALGLLTGSVICAIIAALSWLCA